MERGNAYYGTERCDVMKEYITALKESLEKKVKTLEEMLRLSELQEEALEKEPMDYAGFDRLVDDKDILVDRLEKLDEGFEIVYARVSDELKSKQKDYSGIIKEMQELITRITDLGVKIQSLEEKNRLAISDVMNRDRKKMSESKRSVNVALNYYKNMSGLNGAESQFLDKKK